MKKLVYSIIALCLSVQLHAQNGNNYQYSNNEPVDTVIFKNILSIAPIQATENGFGCSISWERFLDKKGNISFNMPLIVTMNSNTENDITQTATMAYVMPGIKIYPNINNYQMAKYSIGPSFILGAGQKLKDVPTNSWSTNREVKSRYLLGSMVNGGVNFMPTPHLYFGTELGLGFSYLNQVDGKNEGITGLVQFAVKFGYMY